MERVLIDCPVCGKPAWWSPVYPWYDCRNTNNHPPQRPLPCIPEPWVKMPYGDDDV